MTTRNRPRPYIGVSGLMTRHETECALSFYWSILRRAGIQTPTHDLMIGVLVSDKTLRGETNKYPRRYPKIGDVHAIFKKDFVIQSADLGVWTPTIRPLNIVHVATDATGGEALRRALDSAVRASTTEAAERCHEPDPRLFCDYCHGPLESHAVPCSSCVERCDGIQINVVWPDVLDLHSFRAKHGPDMRVVLQVGPRALEQIQWNERVMLDRLALYAEEGDAVITDVLVDWSGGTGKQVVDMRESPRQIASIVEKIQERFPSLGVGIAGGLSADNVLHFASVIGPASGAIAGTVSIDSESRLRDGTDGGGNLDLTKLRDYLAVALRAVTSKENT